MIAMACYGAVRANAVEAYAAKSAPWTMVFDGTDAGPLRGWISGVLPHGWHIADGSLAKDGMVENLLTREDFANFELELEWKIGKGASSGIFYRATRDYERVGWSAPEYVLADPPAAASVGGLYAARAGAIKQAGEWNSTRIVVNGTHVEHWLNGANVLDYDLASPQWKARVAASPFARYPRYGLAKRGFIAIRGDAPGTLALRQIRIRALP